MLLHEKKKNFIYLFFLPYLIHIFVWARIGIPRSWLALYVKFKLLDHVLNWICFEILRENMALFHLIKKKKFF